MSVPNLNPPEMKAFSDESKHNSQNDLKKKRTKFVGTNYLIGSLYNKGDISLIIKVLL